jgi:hypothetical protein
LIFPGRDILLYPGPPAIGDFAKLPFRNPVCVRRQKRDGNRQKTQTDKTSNNLSAKNITTHHPLPPGRPVVLQTTKTGQHHGWPRPTITGNNTEVVPVFRHGCNPKTLYPILYTSVCG